MSGFFLLVGFIILQRLSELVISKRNAEWMMKRGAVEAGRRHYPFAVALHLGFLVSLIAEVLLRQRHPASWWWIPFAMFVLAQGLRYWCMISLGHFWNTRIFVLRGAKVVRRGPYRFLRHPNYLAVAAELLSIPLIFQAYLTAILFSLLNLVFLSVRIPTEEKALSEATDYRAVFSDKPAVKRY